MTLRAKPIQSRASRTTEPRFPGSINNGLRELSPKAVMELLALLGLELEQDDCADVEGIAHQLDARTEAEAWMNWLRVGLPVAGDRSSGGFIDSNRPSPTYVRDNLQELTRRTKMLGSGLADADGYTLEEIVQAAESVFADYGPRIKAPNSETAVLAALEQLKFLEAIFEKAASEVGPAVRPGEQGDVPRRGSSHEGMCIAGAARHIYARYGADGEEECTRFTRAFLEQCLFRPTDILLGSAARKFPLERLGSLPPAEWEDSILRTMGTRKIEAWAWLNQTVHFGDVLRTKWYGEDIPSSGERLARPPKQQRRTKRQATARRSGEKPENC